MTKSVGDHYEIFVHKQTDRQTNEHTHKPTNRRKYNLIGGDNNLLIVFYSDMKIILLPACVSRIISIYS